MLADVRPGPCWRAPRPREFAGASTRLRRRSSATREIAPIPAAVAPPTRASASHRTASGTPLSGPGPAAAPLQSRRRALCTTQSSLPMAYISPSSLKNVRQLARASQGGVFSVHSVYTRGDAGRCRPRNPRPEYPRFTAPTPKAVSAPLIGKQTCLQCVGVKDYGHSPTNPPVCIALDRYGMTQCETPMRTRHRLIRRSRYGGNLMTKLIVSLAALAALAFSATAQTFSQSTIDTALLPDLVPGRNICLDRAELATPVCEPIAALFRAIKPPPPTDRAVVSAAAVMQLCGAHNIRDVICGEAALLELRYHRVPCWKSNRC